MAEKIDAGKNVVTSTVGATLGIAAAEAIVMANPELAAWRMFIAAPLAGILGGLGNLARDSVNPFVKLFGGWLG